MKTKILGQVFTPNHIIQKMLKMVDYNSSKDLTDIKIIDNSCGDGAFLQEIVKILIEKYGIKAKKYIEKNVFGIEIDKIAFENCIIKLNDICSKNNIFNVQWNIVNENTIKVFKNYQNKFDIVIGNPPYVRIHNTQEDIKEFNFCKSGMTDLYIAFYEMSLNMLKCNGKLCFINPSSIFHSKASFTLREYILKNRLLVELIDFKHQKIFNKITTYSCIVLLDKKNNNDEIIFNNTTKLKYNDFGILGNWYFNEDVYKLKEFKNILLNNKDIVKVKNGVATLCDSILIGDFLKDFKSKYISDIVKCSTLKNTKTIFPYDENFELVDFNKLDKNIQDYLKSQENKLKNRDLENPELWWAYGRNQSIKDKNKIKICINTTVRDINSIKMKILKRGILVYSGLYILIDDEKQIDLIFTILNNQKFINYISLLGKYKSGGYYTFSSNDLKKFIDYYI